MENFEEFSYERTVTRLHLRANDVNSGPFFVNVYGNATPQTPTPQPLYHLDTLTSNGLTLPDSSLPPSIDDQALPATIQLSNPYKSPQFRASL